MYSLEKWAMPAVAGLVLVGIALGTVRLRAVSLLFSDLSPVVGRQGHAFRLLHSSIRLPVRG